MKALEAKQIAQEALASAEQMQPIYDAIAGAANLAQTSIFYYKKISDLQVKQLKNDGYEVKNVSDRDGVMYSIKWD